MLNRRVWSVAHQRQSWRSGNRADKKEQEEEGSGKRRRDDTTGVRDIHAFGVHLCSKL
jgi:hypothetical protein